jgi:hypothetical protein
MPCSSTDISKRKFVCLFAALWVSAELSHFAWAEPSGNDTQDFNAFIQLSALLTGTSHLNLDIARKIQALIVAEPWGREHLTQVAAKLKFLNSAAGAQTPLQAIDSLRFSSGERWFINHLLTTWITGIYYHQIGVQLVTYQQALMFTALDGVRPPPGQCMGEFGYWSSAPAGVLS